ncbi:MAG: hypothetical protein WBW75_14640 [Mycobacterium sp.]|uniref:hypothetical protein n=1 Tax=Mycobacterium sp. TaxID=1785 RepID=UPI003C504CBC
MRVRCIPALCGLAAAALLAACGTNGVHAGTTAPPAPAVPTRAAATAVTAVPVTGPRTEKWIDLKVGECVTDLPPADLSRVTVTVVDCGTAHLAEVYLRAPMAVDSAIANVANQDCAAGFASYTGQSAQSAQGGPYSVTYLIDSNMDRTGATPMPSTVICLVQRANGQPLTGSVRR